MQKRVKVFASLSIAAMLVIASSAIAQTAAQSIDKPFVHP
jgi:hypothetical protein